MDVFAAEHWSLQPLLSAATELPTGFEDLFTVAAVDELLSRRGLRTPFLRLAKDGEVIAASQFTRGGGLGAAVGDQVADDAVGGLFADGATVVLQGLHRTWPPLMSFAGQLAGDLGHPVQVNAYVTPPDSRGFSAHYDTHDVFVLQIAGEKRWAVHEPVLRDPLPSEVWGDRSAAVAAAATAAPLLETVLGPGDALYLPRGYLHSAEALGETSVHLTVGVHPVTRQAVVQALLAEVAQATDLRQSLPLGLDLTAATAADEVAATAASVVEALRATDAEAALGRLRASVWSSSRPAPLDPLRQAAAARSADAATAVVLREHLRCLVRREGDEVVLETSLGRVDVPVTAEAAVRRIASGEALSAIDLPDLDAADGVVLVRRLLHDGIIVPAER